MRRVRSIGFMALLFGFPLTTGGNDRGGLTGRTRRVAGRTGRMPGLWRRGECFSVIPAVVSGNPWYSRIVVRVGECPGCGCPPWHCGRGRDVKVMRRVRSIGCMVLLFGFPLTTGGNDNKGMPGSGRRWGDAPGRVNGGDMPGSGRLGIADGAGDVKVMRRVKSIGFMALLFGFPLTTGGNDKRDGGKNRGGRVVATGGILRIVLGGVMLLVVGD